MRCTPEVDAALREGRPVVALESSVLAQGLPIPANREAASRMIAAVRGRGAIPAITAVDRGAPAAGLDDAALARFLGRDGVRKVSARDLGWAAAHGVDGATTVAASLVLATLAGIEVFATGGIGGVHREPAFDESADLLELARAPMVVVCAGAKSILDLPATVERLETLGVAVVGYRTGEFPGFFTAETGLALDATAETATELALAWRAHRALERPGSLLVVQPPPSPLPRRAVEEAVGRALAEARAAGVRGARVTPFLLAAVERETGGRSLAANLALLERNAALAAEIAVAILEIDAARAAPADGERVPEGRTDARLLGARDAPMPRE
ncbi:MAG TPA: pseudouridine-5'-phosphate glycosidase [Gemmatimonadaceae bacterium]|nr:pseudouridine-5'-phosphate glycosidase [Gemmatimonadaceae bacterium]